MSNSLRPYESQHVRPPRPTPTPGDFSNLCSSSRWCHPAISSSVIHFSSCPQSLPASGSFPMSQLFASGGQSIGVSPSASVLPMNTQDWSPLGWTGWISLQSKGGYCYWKNLPSNLCWGLERKISHQQWNILYISPQNILFIFSIWCIIGKWPILEWYQAQT